MQNNNTVLIVIILVIGVALGYLLGNNCLSDSHVMPNGSVMSNSMGMHDMMAEMTIALEGKTGDDFDRAFLEEMIVHHEGAVEMAEMVEKSAKHQEIKDMSKAIISAQTAEIAQMKGWLRVWYGR
jgi:uncharacterized protein (DUF305 family)